MKTACQSLSMLARRRALGCKNIYHYERLGAQLYEQISSFQQRAGNIRHTSTAGRNLVRRVRTEPPSSAKGANGPFVDIRDGLPNWKGPSQLSKRWLRDHCHCNECVDPITQQRNVDVLAMQPARWSISSMETTENNVEITWSDGHSSSYDRGWLEQSQRPSSLARTSHGTTPPKLSTKVWEMFQNDGFAASVQPEVDFDSVMNSQVGLFEWVSKIRLYGFCFVKGCPVETGPTQKLIERIGPLANTHYGQFHEMTANLASKDTAYTEAFLPPHNDTTYFTTPIGLQMLHLLSHENGTGGESQLVNAFAAAAKLKTLDLKAYNALSDIKVTAHASGNEGVALGPSVPFSVLNIESHTQQLISVRWNPADRAFVLGRDGVHTHRLAQEIEEWYHAAALFQEILNDKTDKNVFYEFKLQPGRPLMFDNWRVLHGRSSFTGARKMCGGYVDHDYFRSTYKALRAQTKVLSRSDSLNSTIAKS